MLCDHREAKKKLRPSYRGPFVVTGFGGDIGHSYTLRQIRGGVVPKHYHGDALRKFRPREGYLVNHSEAALLEYQNIRLGRGVLKLPRDLRPVQGA